MVGHSETGLFHLENSYTSTFWPLSPPPKGLEEAEFGIT